MVTFVVIDESGDLTDVVLVVSRGFQQQAGGGETAGESTMCLMGAVCWARL